MSAADSMVWLLPALAVSAAIVAISTYVDSTIPTVAFAGGWLVAVGAWLDGVPRGLRGVSIDGLVSHRPAVQVALLLATWSPSPCASSVVTRIRAGGVLP